MVQADLRDGPARAVELQDVCKDISLNVRHHRMVLDGIIEIHIALKDLLPAAKVKLEICGTVPKILLAEEGIQAAGFDEADARLVQLPDVFRAEGSRGFWLWLKEVGNHGQ